MLDTWQKLLKPQTSFRDRLASALRHKRQTAVNGASSGATTLATGDGWRVVDVICTAGPDDHPFEERHGGASVSLVLAGTFVYRGDYGSSLMAPGSLLIGSPGRSYECSHSHGEGDH